MTAKKSFKIVAKEWIAVNKEIDRMSDHKYKSLGSIKASASDIAEGWMENGLSYDDVMKDLEHNKEVLESLKKIMIGGNVYVAAQREIIVYTRIA